MMSNSKRKIVNIMVTETFCETNIKIKGSMTVRYIFDIASL